jgi:hypothetical protein
MFKGFLIVLFVLLFRICHAQLAERWTLSELDIKLNAPKSLFWDHQSGRLLLLANDSSEIPQVNSINQLYSNVEQLTRDTLFKISVSCFQPTGTLMVSGITRENYEIIKYHPGNKQAVPLINRNLQKKRSPCQYIRNHGGFCRKRRKRPALELIYIRLHIQQPEQTGQG